MRKVIAAAVAVVSLTLVGVAVADFSQASNITLTARQAGKSTGIKADIHSTTTPGEAPKAAKLLVLRFPSGTRFGLGHFKACTLSDKQIESGRSCPAASQIGTGSATASAYPLPQTITARVKSYVAGPNRMLQVIRATQPIPETLVIRATTSGATLTIPVPAPMVAGFTVVLTSLKLNVPARGTGHGALITAGRCKAGSFMVNSHFVYTDGSQVNLQSASPCR